MKHIPNILSFIRLLMIPVFVVYYFKYSEPSVTYKAALIYLLAWFTDALDGYLARKNNWITDLGKVLDPVADKLMQFAAALCFAVDNAWFLIVAIPLFIKETIMLIGGILVKRRKKVVVQALWYGKLATVILFICALLRIFIRDSIALDSVICVVMLSMLIFSLMMYYLKVFKGKYNETIRNKHEETR